VAPTNSEPHKAGKSLGIMFAPSGCSDDETEYLRQKGQAWGNHVRSSSLTRDEVWYSLQHMIMKTIEYPLIATTMTKTQLDRVVIPILQIGLPRSGICRTISRSLVFSSTKYQGIGICHPFVTQGARKLLQLFSFESKFTQELVSIAYNTTMIESGLGLHFLDQPYEPVRKTVDRN
jgi:hypothetical protein